MVLRLPTDDRGWTLGPSSPKDVSGQPEIPADQSGFREERLGSIISPCLRASVEYITVNVGGSHMEMSSPSMKYVSVGGPIVCAWQHASQAGESPARPETTGRYPQVGVLPHRPERAAGMEHPLRAPRRQPATAQGDLKPSSRRTPEGRAPTARGGLKGWRSTTGSSSRGGLPRRNRSAHEGAGSSLP
jgi:hypothetical protein